MAKVRWKKHKSLKPEAILGKIDSAKIVKSDGSVSHNAFVFHDAAAALPSMLDFPYASSELNRASIIDTALSKASKKGSLTPSNLLQEINNIVTTTMAARPIEYRMLTSISIAHPCFRKVMEIDNVKIRILLSQYPEKYQSRDRLINEHRDYATQEPADYAKIIASCKERTQGLAVTRMLKSLDIFRAICCLLVNNEMEILGNEWVPINKILLGGVHTLHEKSGETVNDSFWYEPNFVRSKIFKARSNIRLRKEYKWITSRLTNCFYEKKLKESLLRYVRALDENNPSNALIKLWGALEAIASPNKANYENITKRCSFLFKEREYHRQILEHIRETRNQSIHAGDQMEKSKTHCLQLQYYYRNLMLFHLEFSGQFNSVDEANSFLDLSREVDILERKKVLLERAIAYISG